MHWLFRKMAPAEVEKGITQRDQFRSDELGLAAALVREAVQNSLDAGLPKSRVRVQFSFPDLSGKRRVDFLKRLFDGQLEHAEAAGVDISDIDFSAPQALVIEDFGTCGLTGATDSYEDSHFSDFWRRHGRSHKSGTNVGRWGLGKLVFSSSSRLRTFFGLTIRDGETDPLLMGQCVLDVHKILKTKYDVHGFFADERTDKGHEGFQIPLTNEALLNEFTQNFKLSRSDEAGLSVVILFPNEEISLDDMIAVGITTYFFPILADRLVLDFDGVIVDSDSLRSLAEEYAPGRIKDPEALFTFINELHTHPDSNLVHAKKDWASDFMLQESGFSEDQLSKMRHRYAKGELISVRLPLTLREKRGEKRNTYVTLFLQSGKELEIGHDLYIRGGITLPREARFRGSRKALGALVADDPVVVGFLGDAENPAHTEWNAKAEKLIRNWRYPSQTLRAIRNTLVRLYDMLAQSVEEEDTDALLEFLWTPATKAQKNKKQRKSPDEPIVIPPPTPKVFRVVSRKNGFCVQPDAEVRDDQLPIGCTIKVAYDILTGNPFSRYDPLDFDFSSLAIEAKNATVIEASKNILDVTLDSRDFMVTVTGFDDERDIVVRAASRAIE